VAILGCRTRGLVALAIVFLALVIATLCAGRALSAKDRALSAWWVATAGILALPALLVLGPLG
jgi:hypothetical protein